MVHGISEQKSTKLRVGMVGGGQGAFIGAVHRMALRLDGEIELVAGAFSSSAEVSKASGADLGLDPQRCYGDYAEMAQAEAARADGIQAVIVVTPNHLHVPVARAFLDAGIDVICDKPLSATLAEAEELAAQVRRTGLMLAVTLNNTGYAMVRQARQMVAAGELGELRIVKAEYVQDWLTLPIDAEGQKQAAWRTDPAQAGRSACLADIGVHAHSLAGFVSGLRLDALAADLATFVPGRRLDDNAHVLLRYEGGVRGVLVASQVSPGNLNNLSVKIYGSKAGLEWHGTDPETLLFTPYGAPEQRIRRGGPGTRSEAERVSRMPADHPEGYVEGFGNLYRDAAHLILARRNGHDPDPAVAACVPTVEDGLEGMRFIEAAVQSSEKDSAWVNIQRK